MVTHAYNPSTREAKVTMDITAVYLRETTGNTDGTLNLKSLSSALHVRTRTSGVQYTIIHLLKR